MYNDDDGNLKLHLRNYTIHNTVIIIT